MNQVNISGVNRTMTDEETDITLTKLQKRVDKLLAVKSGPNLKNGKFQISIYHSKVTSNRCFWGL